MQHFTSILEKYKGFVPEKIITKFEERLDLEKKVIAIINSKKERDVLIEAGIIPASNAKKRREQLEQLLKENKIG